MNEIKPTALLTELRIVSFHNTIGVFVTAVCPFWFKQNNKIRIVSAS
jgi:hypothetical protein